MNKFFEILKLIRIFNCLMAMFGVAVGAYMTWLVPVYYETVVAALAAFFVCAAGNIQNDLTDIESDRISHPDRVLVRGALSQTFAVWLYIICVILSVLLAAAVNVSVLIMVFAVLVLLFFYNRYLKRIPVVGNLIVALMAALTFMTGGFAIQFEWSFDLPGPIIASVFAFFFHLVREILKDVQDIEGDTAAGVKTLPQLIGVSKSLMAALALFFVLVILTYVPIFLDWFGRYYELITVYCVDLPLLAILIFVWGNPGGTMLKVGSIALKIGMVLGLIALILA